MYDYYDYKITLLNIVFVYGVVSSKKTHKLAEKLNFIHFTDLVEVEGNFSNI